MSPSTCQTYTAALRPYLDACSAAGAAPVPADERTLLRFITDMGRTGHYRTGEPLSASTVATFRHALTRLHAQRGEANPFDRYPRTKVLLDGYAKRYATPTIEAHAVRAAELEDLLLATAAEAFPDARDQVILTVLTDPEVLVNGEPTGAGLPHIAATRLCWTHIDFGTDATSDATLVIPRPRAAGADVYTVPNRCRGLGPVPTAEGLLGAQRLCGVTALALLDDARRMRGLRDSAPVLLARTGGAMTAKAIRKVITKAAERRGLAYAVTYGADDRLTLLDALAEPSLLRLRDAAIMATMWWASLRRSEAAALHVGDVAEETRKRGMIVVLGRDKQGNPGTFTPVGHLANPDGTRHAIDLQTTLLRWLAAYETWMQVTRGRSLREDDPLFPNLQNARGEALSSQAVGMVLARYASAAGIAAELGERISSHGFRRGFAQEASAKGVSAQEIARLQRRRSVASVLTYTGRPSDPFESSLSFLVEGLDEDVFNTAAVQAALADRARRFRHRP